METNTGKRYETAMIAILYSKKRTASSRNDLLRAAAAVDTTVQRIVEDSLYLASRYTLFAADVQKLDSYRRGLTSPSTYAAVNDITINTALLSQQSHAVHVLIKNILGDEGLDKFVNLLEAGCNVTGE
jgi:hypothetical protein